MDESLASRKHAVIESREDEIRRYFSCRDVSKFDVGECLLHSSSVVNLKPYPSTSYFTFYDTAKDRRIFVSSRVTAQSALFQQEHGIAYSFNVLKKSTNHESFHYMSNKRRQWWIDNMMHVAIQMLDSEGDIVLYCLQGRSRSPMYLVAYLVIIYNMSADAAMNEVREMLYNGRGEELDRFGCLKPIIELIHCRI